MSDCVERARRCILSILDVYDAMCPVPVRVADETISTVAISHQSIALVRTQKRRSLQAQTPARQLQYRAIAQEIIDNA